MGTVESKVNHRYRTSKHRLCRNERPLVHNCYHKNKQLEATRNVGNKNLSRGIDDTLVSLTSSPLNPSLQGSVLHYSFPMQRSHSEIQIISNELSNHHLGGSFEGGEQFDHISYDYQKHMERVDEENRPVLEGLCPDKMYVSTNDLRICDTQRLPPPLRCKMTQGFFRPIPPAEFYQKKTTLNPSFL
ncbi:unnamed protein product [Rotaria socialis]|uniref:Uncharacterized protein n=1 Tax=Rotaria socialis TaxID=392032 RepID=A0A818W8H0_9BILA|nr:unnamed protein product [Rotaria socialis]CAF4199900.1 unnamed protein product [Rotaria socialis]